MEISGADADRQATLDRQPLRTYDLQGREGAQLVSQSGLRKCEPPAATQLRDVNGTKLYAALAEAAEERKSGLQSPAPTLTRVVPEDGSLRVRAMHMALIGQDQTRAGFPIQMAQIGEIEGFEVVLRVPFNSADRLRRQFEEEGTGNVRVVGVSGEGDFWSEDQGDLDVDGNVRVPAPRGELLEAMQEAGFRDRIARLYAGARLGTCSFEDLAAKAKKDYPDALFSMVGVVAQRNSHEVLAALALAKGTKIRANISHLEGGNLLVGTMPDGRGYALVGRDSLVQTRALLRKDLGREVSEAEVRAAVAADLGIAAKDVHAVEQPGDFHIDMFMVPVAPGEVLLNDAVAAAKLMEKWDLEDHVAGKPQPPGPGASRQAKEQYESDLDFWKSLGDGLKKRFANEMKRAEKAARFETLVARDLEQAGVKVHREPAVFGASANFVNAEQGTNPRGERYYVALGGDKRAERLFVDTLSRINPEIARVHFLDREITQTTLIAGGGISCRVKTEGTLQG